MKQEHGSPLFQETRQDPSQELLSYITTEPRLKLAFQGCRKQIEPTRSRPGSAEDLALYNTFTL